MKLSVLLVAVLQLWVVAQVHEATDGTASASISHSQLATSATGISTLLPSSDELKLDHKAEVSDTTSTSVQIQALAVSVQQLSVSLQKLARVDEVTDNITPTTIPQSQLATPATSPTTPLSSSEAVSTKHSAGASNARSTSIPLQDLVSSVQRLALSLQQFAMIRTSTYAPSPSSDNADPEHSTSYAASTSNISTAANSADSRCAKYCAASKKSGDCVDVRGCGYAGGDCIRGHGRDSCRPYPTFWSDPLNLSITILVASIVAGEVALKWVDRQFMGMDRLVLTMCYAALSNVLEWFILSYLDGAYEFPKWWPDPSGYDPKTIKLIKAAVLAVGALVLYRGVQILVEKVLNMRRGPQRVVMGVYMMMSFSAQFLLHKYWIRG